jgi:hypothetical protein
LPESVRRLARSLIVAGLAVGGLLASVGTAAAYAPDRELDHATAARQAPTRETKPVAKPPSTRGFDISYPQCGKPYPRNPAFGIVGVNGGKVFSVNPCLAGQIAWGGGTRTELYINTGNPGPELSTFWPSGQTVPRVCDANDPDTADCAFDYGWNAAKHSFETAQTAYQQLGLTASPAATTWWLDVETSNTWRTDAALNNAALEGEVAYLRDVAGVTKLGFYSTTVQWNAITGGTKAFAPAPSWGAGAPTEKVAKQHCTSTAGFTGGRLALVQYPYQGFDANVRC